MPTIEQNREHLIRSNLGLAFLVLAVVICLIVLIRLRRWSSFREMLSAVAPGVLPLAMLTVNPFLALLSLGTAVYAEKFRPLRLTLWHVLLLALLIRLPLMGQSFWYDEAFTERLTTLTVQELIPAIQSDTHPPVYYSLMWLWSHVAGHGEFMLRVPSLLFGLLGIALLYRLVRALGLSERVALIAALLVSVTPAAMYYATEARSYALLTCAVFGAIICILEDRPLGFIVCTALTGWLHNLGLFYVPALVYAAFRYWEIRVSFSGWQTWRRTFVGATGLACFWLPLTLQQMSGVSNGFWIAFDAGTPFTVFTLNSLYLPREYILPILLPTIFLTFVGFWAARRWLLKAQGRALMIVLVGPPAIAVIVSLLWAPVFLSRVFLPLTLLSLIPLAYAIDRHWRLLSAVAAPLFISGMLVFYGSADLLRPDFRQIVNRDCQSANAMYYTAVDTALTLAPYWQGKSLTWVGGQDRGLTFGVEQLPLFNLDSGDISEFSGLTVCTVYLLTPRTLATERDYIEELASAYPHRVIEHDIHDELQVWVYRFEVA
jgi:hypothetical protein